MGGRKPGVKNKNTEIKELFRGFVAEEYDSFVEAYKGLKPKDRCMVYLKASEFVLPKISSVKFEDEKFVNNALELLRAKAQYNS